MSNGGTDWINLAAMSGNLVVRLGAGESSTGTTASGSVREIFKIGAGVAIENAVTGDGNDIITGNYLANRLHGMRGNDTIDGGAGGDTLSGGAGSDTLTGGIGLDFFLFDRALNALTNVDIITDFSHLDDAIWLDATIFAGLSLGELSADAFFAGTSAQDELDRIIYDSLTGALYFDADGSGSGGALQFATLLGSPVDLSFDDFTVVSTDPDTITTTTDRTTTTDPSVVRTDLDEPSSDGTPIVGTGGNDTLRSKNLNDRIFGLAGGDMITGGDGDDYIDGGADIDGILGGAGNDTLIGGGSSWRWGDFIGGGEGDDLIFGSGDQPNDTLELLLGQRGDLLEGNEGNDHIYGLDGDDDIRGNAGNDILEGGRGSDSLSGGSGDDRIFAGEGERDIVAGNDGFDTVVLSGNFADYRFYLEPYEEEFMTLERLGQTGEIKFTTRFSMANVEALEFADGTINLQERNPLVANIYEPLDGESVTFDNSEVGLNLFRAGTYDVYDGGPADRLQKVNVVNWNFGLVRESNITIHSDALTHLEIGGLEGSVTVDAAAGERTLTLQLNPEVFAFDNPGEDVISDDTATSINFVSQFGGSGGGNNVNYFNGAAVDGYNFSFASAETIAFTIHEMNTRLQWFIPNVTTIDLTENQNRVGIIFESGNTGHLTIETALDDSLLATAGGSAEFRFIGGTFYDGSELIRFGNLGEVNLSNDGTSGDDAQANEGLGLRGSINLGAGSDEAWILGTGAFQGGTLDGGTGVDFLRMNFAVAAAIGDIKEHITGFEGLRLGMSTLTGQVVDVTKFGNFDKIEVVSTSVAGGDNTITNIADSATVTFASGLEATEGTLLAFEMYGNQFGTVHLDMAGDGEADTLNLSFVGYAIDSYSNGERPVGLDEGTVHVVDAETVNITTEAFDELTFIVDIFTQPIDYLSYDPTDPFTQVLDLDVTTTVTLSGETGWDFTAAGTDIGKLATLDASGVTGYGVVGAVKAIAQTDEGVTFIGGAGDDELTGGAGNDALTGGTGGNDLLDGAAGIDKAVFAGNWGDYDITVGDDGLVTLASLLDGTVDTVRNVELFKFADGTVSFDNLSTGIVNEPPGVSLANITPSIAENAPTVSRIKVADIVLADDARGTNRLSLVGRDAALFEIIGMALFLKAGAILDASKASELEVAVAVDDDAIPGTPDAVSDTYRLAVDDIPGLKMIHGTAAGEKLSGTSGNDYFDGHGGSDTFTGGKGNDTYVVDSSGDKVVEKSGQGTDTVLSTVSHKLASYVENLTLLGDGAIDGTGTSGANVITGNAGNNRLYGGSGNDVIEGGGGDDVMDGGSGTDTLSYEHAASDVTVSLALSGPQFTGDSTSTDTLKGFENLRGSAFADHLTGSSGKNSIWGGAGDDEIDGGKGNDTLSGGTGADAFIFKNGLSSSSNKDKITDFSVADGDQIWLDHDIFTKLAGLDGSALSADQFWKGSGAHDADDRIIYNAKTGVLIYDSNGKSHGGQVEIAVLSKGLDLTHDQFFIV